MENPFIATISDIQGPDIGISSRCETVHNYESLRSEFHERRMFVMGVLASWSLSIGQLNYSKDNDTTLKCLLQLIKYRQRDLTNRNKMKDDLTEIQFQRDKYSSMLEQCKRALQEKNKALGRIENECIELKNRLKSSEVTVKKDRDEDKKMLTALRCKNQQVMHQMKKKQQEVNRFKEQLKKSLVDKTIGNYRNSFDVVEKLLNAANAKNQTRESMSASKKDQYAFINERNDGQLKKLRSENSYLKDKMFDLREELVEFMKWIDSKVFGENSGDTQEVINRKYRNKFVINHNLLFKKDSLVTEFREMLQTAKDGLQQLQSLHKRTGDTKNRSPQIHKKNNATSPVQGRRQDSRPGVDIFKPDAFQKKKQATRATYQSKDQSRPKPQLKQTASIKMITKKDTNMTKSKKQPSLIHETDFRSQTSISAGKDMVQVQSKLQFGDDLLDACLEGEESIVSYIEPAQLIRNNVFDRMGDILFSQDK